METSIYLMPVRVFFDSRDMVTKYEHLNMDTLYNSNSQEIEERFSHFSFNEVDQRFSSFTFSYYLLPVYITFDSIGKPCCIRNTELEVIYGKNTLQLSQIFQN